MHAKGPDFASFPATNIAFERYAIIITLAVIPISLKLFHSYHQKIKSLNQDVFIKKYTTAYYLRLFIFDIVAILNLTGFQLYNSHNTMYLTIMIIFALFFCYPNKQALQNKSENEKPEND
jgi:nicotinamide riboside transporter PnuC